MHDSTRALVGFLNVSEIGIDRLYLRVMLNRLQSILTTYAGLFVAAKRYFRRGHIVVVDPDDAGLQSASHVNRCVSNVDGPGEQRLFA